MALKKLLIADDSLTIQKVIRLALSGAAAAASGKSEGYEIQAVSDGNDAVQQISLFRPDVVLIDVSLPGKTATEVKRSVNQHRDLDHVRFVLMSSAFEKVDEKEVLETVFHGRLTKPFDPAHLREVLGQVLAQVGDLPPPVPENPLRVDETTKNIHLHESQSKSSITKSAPMPTPSHEPDADIRQLTESTIRQSGLNEIAEISPPPLPELRNEEPAVDFSWDIQERAMKPGTLILDTGNANFPAQPPSDFPADLSSTSIPELPRSEPTVSFAPPPPSSAPREPARDFSASVDSDALERKMEQLIAEKIEKILPETAERLIKAEIHRLLSEGP